MNTANISGNFAQGLQNALALGARTRQAGVASQEASRRDLLDNVFQQHGPGIVQGDQNALAALAQVDPMAAFNVRDKLTDNRAAEQNIRLREKEFQFTVEQARKKAEAMTAQLSAEQAAEAAKQADRIVEAAAGINDPQMWTEWFVSQGVSPDEVPDFRFKDQHIAEAMGLTEALEARAMMDEMNAGPQPQSGLGKIQADINAGLLPQETPLRAGQQQEIVYGPDGQPIYQRGGGKPLNVEQGKATGFFIRMRDSNAVLNELDQEGSSLRGRILEGVPFGVGNFAQSPEYQRFEQARRDFINAVLRRESGAVISDQEFDNADKQYFPVPGDSPEVIEQKRLNRLNAIAGIEISAAQGADAASTVDNYGTQSDPSPDVSLKVGEMDFGAMSTEELQKFIAENGG